MKYYKEGVLIAKPAEKSRIGLDVNHKPVKIIGKSPINNNKFYVNRAGNVVEEQVLPVKFYIENMELHPNSYPLLINEEIEPHKEVYFRIRGKYCSLFNREKSKRYNKDSHKICINGYFNNNLPSNFNLVLGYED